MSKIAPRDKGEQDRRYNFGAAACDLRMRLSARGCSAPAAANEGE